MKFNTKDLSSLLALAGLLISRVKATRLSPENACGSVLGDHHILRWDGPHLSWLGECDLVMLHKEGFNGRNTLDLHIRTAISNSYNFVESVAIQIDDRVIEISKDEYYVDGTPSPGLPILLKGYEIWDQTAGDTKTVLVDLNNGEYIEVRIYKDFLGIKVCANQFDIGYESVGFLGKFPTGNMLDRNGNPMTKADDYFAEWQVRQDDPKLFHDNRPPQLPSETCRMPSMTGLRGPDSSKLRNEAEEACKNKPVDAFDTCVFDVIATGDVGMAGAR